MKPAIRAPIPPRTVEKGGRRRPKVHRSRTADLFEEYEDEKELDGQLGDNESDSEAQAHSDLVNGDNDA